MKYRTPAIPNNFDFNDIPEPDNLQSNTYKIKVISPIYGGGVEAGKPDIEMPIRASAIRGQLRYWWRFLKMNDPDHPLEDETLFQEERKIWGGMGDESELKTSGEKDFSSKVFIRITGFKRVSPPVSCCEYQHYKQDDQTKYRLVFLHDIPQYALFPGQGKAPNAENYHPEKDKPHQVLLAGVGFELEISTDKKINQQEWKVVEQSMRWWASFGGIGARTRRGLGSVEVEGIPPLTEAEVNQYGCELKQINARNAMDAWNKAINKLQQFRQGVDVGRNQKKDQNGNLVFYDRDQTIPAQGRSRWPEPDSIREIIGTNAKKHKPVHPARISFPRAAFGLPIIFKFNNGDERAGDPEQFELRPIRSERMASPLILKAMASGTSYKAIALKMPTENLFKSLKLKLNNVPDKPENLSSKKTDEWKRKEWDKWPQNWWDSSKAAQVKPIKDNKGIDSLTAFMYFFVSREKNNG